MADVTSTPATQKRRFGMFLRGFVMNKTEFQLPNGGDLLLNVVVGIPGNNTNLSVSVSRKRFEEIQLEDIYDGRVEYAVSQKTNKTYLQEVQ